MTKEPMERLGFTEEAPHTVFLYNVYSGFGFRA